MSTSTVPMLVVTRKQIIAAATAVGILPEDLDTEFRTGRRHDPRPCLAGTFADTGQGVAFAATLLQELAETAADLTGLLIEHPIRTMRAFSDSQICFWTTITVIDEDTL